MDEQNLQALSAKLESAHGKIGAIKVAIATRDLLGLDRQKGH
jgi:hypothetical protein